VSGARPKVAAYPFTTLVPNLGVVSMSEFGGEATENFVIADMPGIIEGASEGKGLGDQFLKHISRTATLVYVLDPFSYEGLSMEDQFKVLQKELKAYNAELLKKDFFVVMNKIDSIPEEDRKKLSAEFLKAFPKVKKVFRMVSGVSGENLHDFMFELLQTVRKNKEALPRPTEESAVIDYVPTRFLDESSFQVEHMYKVSAREFQEPVCGNVISPETMPWRELYKVSGKRIEQISRMTNPLYPDAIVRVYDVLVKMGIQRALVRAGAVNGDLVKIGPRFYEFHAL
jgi:Obg family GTPase CgtA-like protein